MKSETTSIAKRSNHNRSTGRTIMGNKIGFGFMVLAFTLVACESIDSPPETRSTTGPASGSESGCQWLSEKACAADASCMAVFGQRINQAEHCVDAAEFAVCMDVQPCGGLVSHARDARGDVWQFPSTCMPPVWSVVSSQDYIDNPCVKDSAPADDPPPVDTPPDDPPRKECSLLSVNECLESMACAPIVGRRVDVAEECVGPVEVVGCMQPGVCGAAMTTARDAAGDLWEFPSTCVPSSWEEALGNFGFEKCSPDPNLDVACPLLSESECLANYTCPISWGHPIDEVAHCEEPDMLKTCVDLSECEPLPSYVRDPAGNLWHFDRTCPRDGWTIEESPTYEMWKCGADG